MKNLTNLIFAAAALVVTAGMAKAEGIKAEVPFAFRAGGKLMPAGEYRVTERQTSGGGPVFTLVNADAHSAVMAMAQPGNPTAKDDPSMTFACSSGNCALIKMTAGKGLVYGFGHPSWGKNEDTRVSVIRAVLVK